MVITERQLVFPALLIMSKTDGEISTTSLSQELRRVLRPSGDDLEILAGRLDDKFSQKVRNLRSHKTLEEMGTATYTNRGGQGYWRITEAGRALVTANIDTFDIITQHGFSPPLVHQALDKLPIDLAASSTVPFDEDVPVREGGSDSRLIKIYQRSRRLRDYVIQKCLEQGPLTCESCDFDFEEFYGPLGSGFIEVHHNRPIFCRGGQSEESRIGDAVRDVALLCANCHRMVHRTRESVMDVGDLRQLLQERRKI